MDEVVVKIENLKKQYRLGMIGGGTLSADLQSWWARKRGKEDPNTKIDEKTVDIGTKFWALNGIDLEVKKGEALGIIGSNGAGKSTLLKILSRVTAPTEGEIKIKGRISSMLEVGTGFHGEMTGRENIYMNGAILGMGKKEVDSKIEDIIDFSECRQFIDTPVKRYSSGMYVKLAFAVAAHLDAEIMVMDEVLAVGDLKFQEKCLGKMGNAASNEGKTVLYVSHNMSTIKQLCTRCIVLEHGRVIFNGKTDEAIGVYMGNSGKEFPVAYDFSSISRPSSEHGSILFLKSLEFLGKQSAIYGEDEKIYMEIRMRSSREIGNIRARMVVHHIDGSVAGMAQSEDIAYIKETDDVRVRMEFDPKNLVDGVYYTNIDLYTLNQYGAHHSYDQPRKEIFFEIRRLVHKGIIWQRRYWGSVMLNPLRKVM